MSTATLDDIDVTSRRVLLRVDFNVPLRDGSIGDDRRMRAALPTIEELRRRRARVIVATHLGRPRGRVEERLRVGPLAQHLAELLGADVPVAGDVAGAGARALSERLRDGDVGMLENVRFEAGEEANDPAFADALAALADVYVNDAFGAAHRAHASTEGVAHRLPAVAGRLMARELAVLSEVLQNPRPPLVAIVGGAKISTKVAVLQNLLQRVDVLWVGGAMACTFYRAQGHRTGSSLVEEDQVETARRLLQESDATRGRLALPVDAVVAQRAEAGAATRVAEADAIPDGWMVVDVGPRTRALMARDCASAGTVVWNGPLGIYEIEEFAAGTREVARAVAASAAFSVAGGGDLGAALDAAGVADRFDHISTGGGATIEFLEGRTLPGVAALRQREPTP